MKSYLILLIAILCSLAGYSQTHFVSVHAGTNAEAYMSIRIFSGTIGLTNMQSGDEIGVFDGSICVGSTVLSSELNSTVSVIAAKRDIGQTNGYLSGNAIAIKIWDASTNKEYNANVDFAADSPRSVFTDNESAYVNISTKEAITINLTAGNKVYDGTDNATVNYTTDATIAGNVTISVTNGKFNNKTVEMGKTVTASISASGADAGKYNFTINNTTTANITARPITITADAKSKTYGDTDPALTAQITAGSVISGDAATGTLSRAAGTAVNTYAINKGTYTYGANYNETFVSANLTIAAKTITIKPYAKSKSYGDADPAFTYQAVPSLVSGDSFTGAPGRNSGETIGTYNYTLGNLSAGSNYSLTLDGSTVFEITKKTLTLAGLSVGTKVYDGTTDATLNGTASLSGIVGSESVTLIGTPVAAFASAGAGNPVNVNISGYSLSGTNAGNYILNTTLTGIITPRELTVTGAVAQNKVYDGTATANISGGSLSGTIGSDIISIASPAYGVFAKKDVGTNISVTGNSLPLTGTGAENYSAAFPSGLKASITPKGLTIVPTDQTKCLGATGSFAGTEFTSTGLVSGDAISKVTLATTGLNASAAAGAYDIVASSAIGTGLGNYTISYGTGKLTVEQLPAPTISGSVPVTQVPIQVGYTTEAGMKNYVWSITSGGTITSGAGTRQVTVNWTSMTNQSITVTYSNNNGCSGTSTRTITLTPLPTAVLSGSADVCSGGDATLSVALTGVSPWKITYTDGTNSKTITGINTSPYAFKVTPSASGTTSYSITNVTDGNDMSNTGTGTAVLTALPAYVAPTLSNTLELCYGAGDAAITAKVSSTQSSMVKYQWQSSQNNEIWTDIANATSLTFAPGVLYNTVYYRINASITGCEIKSSNSIKVTVHEPITNAVVSCVQQTVCFGDIPQVLTSTPSSGGNGIFSYQWQQEVSGKWINVGTNSLSYQPSTLTATTTFRVISRDMGTTSCGSVYSNEMVITVKDPILGGEISADQKIVTGAKPAPFASVTPGSGSGTITYSWESSIDNGVTWTTIGSEKNATYASAALTQPTWFRRITTSTVNSISCSATSNIVKVNLWPTGIDDQGNISTLNAYAANSKIIIKGRMLANSIASLYDMNGKLILVKNMEEGTLNEVPTTFVKTGIYLLTVRNGALILSFKIPVNK